MAEAPAAEAPPAWARALLDKVEQLEGELRTARAATPTFRPMSAPSQVHKGRAGIFADLTPGPGGAAAREGVSRQVLVDERGDKLPQMILSQYPPRFLAGDRCRVNPDAVRPGFPEGQTWGTILSRLGIDGVGQVRKVYWLRDTGEWKVSAVIRGLTNQRPDGFLDSELLPV